MILAKCSTVVCALWRDQSRLKTEPCMHASALREKCWEYVLSFSEAATSRFGQN